MLDGWNVTVKNQNFSGASIALNTAPSPAANRAAQLEIPLLSDPLAVVAAVAVRRQFAITRPLRQPRRLRKKISPFQSARGLAHSKTLRAIRKSPVNASRLGLRRPSAAFPATSIKPPPHETSQNNLSLFRRCVNV